MILSEIAEEDSISMISDRNMVGTNKNRVKGKADMSKSTVSSHSNFANMVKAEQEAVNLH